MSEFSRYYVDLFEYIWQDLVYFFRTAVWENIIKRFYENIIDYFGLLSSDSYTFSTVSWIMVVLTMVLNFTLLFFIIVKIVIWLNKYIAFRKIEIDKHELIEEIAMLNDRVVELVDEKNQIMAMKVSQLGINAKTGEQGEEFVVPSAGRGGRSPVYAYNVNAGYVGVPGRGGEESPSPSRAKPATEPKKKDSRFVKLIDVDREYAGRDTHIYMKEDDTLKLPELVDRFINFAASKMKLYYEKKMISLFFAGLAASKVMILEGISGTGKTSLPYAMGKFFQHDASIISVQPSWRDRAEIIGYLNEFTKRFNETDFLKALYESIYRKDVNFIVLDEMNLARIEYYFAEFLSIMEMPDPSEWKIDLVPDSKESDPLKVINGKITVPPNLWFVGTANKDDSTFTITDKVYDRAIALEFEAKGDYFEAPDTDPILMSHTYLQELFEEAIHKYPVSEDLLDKFRILDNYIRDTFKIAFGNRIMTQVHKFVPVYVATGGTEEDGLDYIFANKILRKFESLNLAFLQDELVNLIAKIEQIFGKNHFEESIRFVKNLQKQI